MSLYNNFIGIDIGKFNFVVATHGTKNTIEYENKSSGIRTFIKEFRKELVSSLCILETTGGYEMELLLTLCNKNFAMHRANTQS
jgi:transposase